LIAIRELDEQLGLTKIAGEYLEDKRHGTGKSVREIKFCYKGMKY